MSRRKTPKLPSMDELLGGDEPTPARRPDSQTPRSQDSQKRKVKVTYYLPADLVDRIDDAHYQLNRAAGRGLKIHKYDMARIAWDIVLESFEQDGLDSELARRLTLGS